MINHKCVVIHSNEIALKGRNRPFFERVLLERVEDILPKSDILQSEFLFGRIIIWLKDNADETAIKESLRRVFGIANFSFAFALEAVDFPALANQALEILQGREFVTFRVSARRADKKFPLSSQEINEQFGALIVKKLGKKVNLENPELNCFIELVGETAFLYFEKEKGPGGLPVGVSGKVLSLLSSGFDSPVASWQLMRRGCRVDFIHFHSYPQTSQTSIENVKEIVKILTRHQYNPALYLVPFLDIQKEITAKSEDASQRVVLYRRFMMRIAQKIAEREKCGALVTGDSLGQVASQTLENIGVISQAITMPIFRPLIGTNKDDIIDAAKKIGTYEISSRPYDDCCSLFLPEHPETRAKLNVILEIEKKLDVERLINGAIVSLSHI